MARRRTKSISDIYSQYRRILDENVRRSVGWEEGSTERRRADRALAAYNKYIENIGREKRRRGIGWNADMQFSQRVYMGLSNG